jgi:hypothetical protein
MKNTEITVREYPRWLVRRWPVTELEGELVSVATHHKSIDRRMQIAGPVIFPSVLKRREPIDASVVRGNIRVEARGNIIDDLRQNAFHRPNETQEWSPRETVRHGREARKGVSTGMKTSSATASENMASWKAAG